MARQQAIRLGAELLPGGARFALWAPRAARVQVCFPNDNRVDLTPHSDGIWHGFVPGVAAGQAYGFRVDGPWDPAAGLRLNPARLLVDPYARQLRGGMDYDGPYLDHVAGDINRFNPADSVGTVPWSVVVADSDPPRPLARPKQLSDSVIYELHVRGFTMNHPRVPEQLRGTYLGLAREAVIEYLLELGITAVELLPVQHFVSEPFLAHKGLRNYWGYNTASFFAPHAAYSATGDPVSEFKTMVSAFHDAGIEVILDVVYNHTAESGDGGPTLSYRAIDQDQYYRFWNGGRSYCDVTGCGNSLDTSQPQVQAMIMDSLRYWATDMGVDGFRFDLATTLIRDQDHRVNHSHPLKQQLETDPILRETKLIVEPWDLGSDGYQVGNWGPRWSEWNDRFRDAIRDFWLAGPTGVQHLATRLCGSPDLFGPRGCPPQASINYITAHDGFTLRDVVSYNHKHNEANGEANHDGSSHNRSFNHGIEGPTDDPAIRAVRTRQARNLLATLLLAAGVPMITAGDEFGRTQLGNNNAYCQDSPISWVSWTDDGDWSENRERIADLLALRANEPLLRQTHFLNDHNPIDQATGRCELTWVNEQGTAMQEGDWWDQSRRTLGRYLVDQDHALLVWFHSGHDPIQVRLPDFPWANGYQLRWHSAEQAEFPEHNFAPGQQLRLPGRCVAILTAQLSASE
ncbi:MAG: glycogen debranching enzyme GlgX [Arachnia propionica]|nr:MAG: glycogen debranching enzyme GlgX [Arachnia propionica]